MGQLVAWPGGKDRQKPRRVRGARRTDRLAEQAELLKHWRGRGNEAGGVSDRSKKEVGRGVWLLRSRIERKKKAGG